MITEQRVSKCADYVNRDFVNFRF